MSGLHLRRVETTLQRLFDGKIDLADCRHKGKEAAESAFRTRALAAYVVLNSASVGIDVAAHSLVDGYGDNGVDAIHYDEPGRTLWVVQSKWIESGEGCPGMDDSLKFAAGARDLLNGRFDRFNSKIRAKEPEIASALSDVKVKVGLVFAYTGSANVDQVVKRPLDDLLEDLNAPADTSTLAWMGLNELYRAISQLPQGEPVSFELGLAEWGQVAGPYKAFYGTAVAEALGQLWEKYGARLLHSNIRKFLGDTDVNDAIQGTLRTRPCDFWYFNNGITFLCGSLNKTLVGTHKEFGSFRCENVALVNGAQSLGSIGRIYGENPGLLAEAKVSVRLVSLEGCPEGYGIELTRATNTQNRVERRDFVSLDPTQERLKHEFWLEGKLYSYQAGEAFAASDRGCGLEEATVALACASGNLEYAVAAKKEIGRLWADIHNSPYTDLFRPDLQATELWNSVQVMRRVDSVLKTAHAVLQDDRRRLYAVHGNRFILFEVFEHLAWNLATATGDLTRTLQRAAAIADKVFEASCRAADEIYPEAVIGRLFYNYKKCKVIDLKVRELMASQEPTCLEEATSRPAGTP